jgi:KDO2-lipid IV(A) lauroyltransferase
MGGWLGRLGYYLDFPRRRLTLKHLGKAYGAEMDERRRRRVARGVYENLGRSSAEICLAKRRGKAFLRGRYTFSGVEHVQACREQGRIIVLLTGHLDNWEMAGAAVTQLLELPVLAVTRAQSDSLLEQWLSETRHRLGMRVHSRGADARGLLARLRHGDILVALVDQDTRGPGCFATFFGRPAYTQTGPAALALRLGAAMIPITSRRNPDGHTHHVAFGPPLRIDAPPEAETLSPSAARARDAEAATRQITALMEETIHQAPDQWVWFHERWKRQPEGR